MAGDPWGSDRPFVVLTYSFLDILFMKVPLLTNVRLQSGMSATDIHRHFQAAQRDGLLSVNGCPVSLLLYCDHPSLSRFLNLFLFNFFNLRKIRGFPDGSLGEEPSCNAGDSGHSSWILGLGRSPREGNGNRLQYSCLGNPVDRGAWWATAQRITKTQLSTHEYHELIPVALQKRIT